MSDIFKVKTNNQWVGIPSLIGPQGPQGEIGPQGPPGVQVNTDWNETDTSSKAYILNKPTNVSTWTNDAGYITQSNVPIETISVNGTTQTITNKNVDVDIPLTNVKVNGTAQTITNRAVDISVPAAQVNSDWNATSGVSQILNKPPVYYAVITESRSNRELAVGRVWSDGTSSAASTIALNASSFQIIDAMDGDYPASLQDSYSSYRPGDTGITYIYTLSRYISGSNNLRSITFSGRPNHLIGQNLYVYYKNIPKGFCYDERDSSYYPDNIYINGICTSIGTYAFYRKSSSNSVIIHMEGTTPPALEDGTTTATRTFNLDKTTIYVPSSALSAYRTAWSYYSSIIQGE